MAWTFIANQMLRAGDWHPMLAELQGCPAAEQEAARLADAELIREWKEGAALVSATARMKQFLAAHTPVRV